MTKSKEKHARTEIVKATLPVNKNSASADKAVYSNAVGDSDSFNDVLRRVRALRELGITERDLEESKLEQVFAKISKLSEVDLQLADALIDAVIDGKDDVVEAFARSVLGIENAEGSALSKKVALVNRRPRAKWAEETKLTKAEGRRNPAQFIREEYAQELAAGTLTRADLKTEDSQTLYDAYVGWIRRHPEDDLGLPTGSRTNLDNVADVLTHQRKLRREWWKKTGRKSHFCKLL